MRNNKFKNIFKGFTATLIKETIGGIAYFTIYEAAVRGMCKFQNKKRKYAQYYDFLVGGGFAGFGYWFVIYPVDVIKTRVQAGQTYAEAFKGILKSGYRGFGGAGSRAIIVNAVSFCVYEETKGLLSLAKEISHLWSI